VHVGANSVKVWTALSIVYVVWGSTYLAIRFTVETMPAELSGGVRFLIAGVILAAVVVVRRGPRALLAGGIRLRNAAICGLLVLMGGNGTVVIAETRVPSGLTALLVASVPLWMIVMRRATGAYIRGLTYVGVVLGLGGVALLFARSGGGDTDLRYAALVLMAAFFWSLGSLLATRIDVPGEPMVLTTVEMLAAGVVMILFAGVRGEYARVDLATITTKSWLALAYLIVFGSLVAFSAYIWVFANAPTSLVSTYAYVNPAVAVALGALLAGERLAPTEILGGLVILTAVLLVVRSEAKQPAPAEPAEPAEPVPALVGDVTPPPELVESCSSSAR
jgi:drug/metabolite transporter (DMT)-like permease